MPSIEQLEKALAADPHDAFVLYGLAIEHSKTGDTERSIEFFDRCLKADPSYCYAYFHKARALEAGDRKDDAIAALEAGVAAARAHGDAKALGEIGEYLAAIRP